MSPRTGRPPKADKARNKSLNIRLTEDELARIEQCAEKLQKTGQIRLCMALNSLKQKNKIHPPDRGK